MAEEKPARNKDWSRIEERKELFDKIRAELTLEKVREFCDEQEFKAFLAQGLHEEKLKGILREEELRDLVDSFKKKQESVDLAHRYLLERLDLLESLETAHLMAERQRDEEKARTLHEIELKKRLFAFQWETEWKKQQLSVQFKDQEMARWLKWVGGLNTVLEKRRLLSMDEIDRAAIFRDEIFPKLIDPAISEKERIDFAVDQARKKRLQIEDILRLAVGFDPRFAGAVGEGLVSAKLTTASKLLGVRKVLDSELAKSEGEQLIKLERLAGKFFQTGHDEVLTFRVTNYSDNSLRGLSLFPHVDPFVHLENLRGDSRPRLDAHNYAYMTVKLFESTKPGNKPIDLRLEFFDGLSRRNFRSARPVDVRFEKFIDIFELTKSASINAPIVIDNFDRYLKSLAGPEHWEEIDLEEMEAVDIETVVSENRKKFEDGAYTEILQTLKGIEAVYADRPDLRDLLAKSEHALMDNISTEVSLLSKEKKFTDALRLINENRGYFSHSKTLADADRLKADIGIRIESEREWEKVISAMAENRLRTAYIESGNLNKRYGGGDTEREGFFLLREGGIQLYGGKVAITAVKLCGLCDGVNHPELEKCHLCGHLFSFKYSGRKILICPNESVSEAGVAVILGREPGAEEGIGFSLVDSNDLRRTGYISRRHAEIFFRKDGCRLKDLSSAYGVFLGSSREPIRKNEFIDLKTGVRFVLGRYVDEGKDCLGAELLFERNEWSDIRIRLDSAPLAAVNQKVEVVDGVGRGSGVIQFRTMLRIGARELDPELDESGTITLYHLDGAYWLQLSPQFDLIIKNRETNETLSFDGQALVPLRNGDLIVSRRRAWRFLHLS